jgi:hypothetical protein
MITLVLFLWVVIISVFVYRDRNGRKPDYGLEYFFRSCAALAHMIILDLLCNYFPDGGWEWGDSWMMIKLAIPVILFQMTSFWILFELSLNIYLGRELLYFDRKELDSGWIDKLFDRLGNVAHLLAKILVLIICILSIITLYNRV